jgi:hypothetical protein
MGNTTSSQHPGWSEQHPNLWWKATLDALNQLSGPIALSVRSNDLVSVIFFGHVGRFSTIVDKRVSNAFDLLECLQELELRAFSPKSPRLTFHFGEIGVELKIYLAEDRREFW